jgi:hypothetical protein
MANQRERERYRASETNAWGPTGHCWSGQSYCCPRTWGSPRCSRCWGLTEFAPTAHPSPRNQSHQAQDRKQRGCRSESRGACTAPSPPARSRPASEEKIKFHVVSKKQYTAKIFNNLHILRSGLKGTPLHRQHCPRLQ